MISLGAVVPRTSTRTRRNHGIWQTSRERTGQRIIETKTEFAAQSILGLRPAGGRLVCEPAIARSPCRGSRRRRKLDLGERSRIRGRDQSSELALRQHPHRGAAQRIARLSQAGPWFAGRHHDGGLPRRLGRRRSGQHWPVALSRTSDVQGNRQAHAGRDRSHDAHQRRPEQRLHDRTTTRSSISISPPTAGNWPCRSRPTGCTICGSTRSTNSSRKKGPSSPSSAATKTSPGISSKRRSCRCCSAPSPLRPSGHRPGASMSAAPPPRSSRPITTSGITRTTPR